MTTNPLAEYPPLTLAQEIGLTRLLADIDAMDARTPAADADEERTRLRTRVARAAKLGGVTAALAVALTMGASVSSSSAEAAVVKPAAVGSGVTSNPIGYRWPSRFGAGTWIPSQGQVYFAAPVQILIPGAGWQPDALSAVQIQRRDRRGRWHVIATLTTDYYGWASGWVPVAPGVDYLRAARPADPWALGATGRTRRLIVTTPPMPYDD